MIKGYFHNKKEGIISALRDYFKKREDVLMAFLFGSWIKDRESGESDIDIAVYLKPKRNILEWQSDNYYESEHQIWREIEKIVKKDRKFYMDFLLRITSEAIDFREWVEAFWMEKEKRKCEITSRR